jgi:hypothetical protein
MINLLSSIKETTPKVVSFITSFLLMIILALSLSLGVFSIFKPIGFHSQHLQVQDNIQFTEDTSYIFRTEISKKEGVEIYYSTKTYKNKIQ